MFKYIASTLFCLVSAQALAFGETVKITAEEQKIISETISAHPQVLAQLKVIPSAIGTRECTQDHVEVRKREAAEYFGNAWLYYKCPALDGETVFFSANATVYKENGTWKAFVVSLWTSKK